MSWRCFGHGRGWFLGGVILLTGWAAMPGAAGAFECPAPAAMTRPGVLRESAAQIAALTGVLSDGDAANHVPAIVADLRRRYPGVENAELMNYLVGAYCPAVGRLSGLSDAERQMRVDRFMRDITPLIYAQPGSAG